jgi:hypothetical protein
MSAPEALRGVVIRRVIAQDHIAPDGERELLALWLQVGDGGIRLTGTEHGWGLRVGEDPLTAYDMAELGRVSLREIDDDALGRRGRVSDASEVVLDRASDDPVGVSWRVEEAEPVALVCVDDVLIGGPLGEVLAHPALRPS